MIVTKQESMTSKTFVNGRIIKRYKIPLDEINELNKEFDKQKNILEDKGPRLAGRIDTELAVNNIVPNLKIMKSLQKNMNDYMAALYNFGLSTNPMFNLEI